MQRENAGCVREGSGWVCRADVDAEAGTRERARPELVSGRVRKRGGGEPGGGGGPGRRRRQAPPATLPDLPAPPPAPSQSLSARSRRRRDNCPAADAAAVSSRAPPPPPAARIPSRRGKQVRQRRWAPRLRPPPTPTFPTGGRSAALRGAGLGRRGTTAEDCGEWGSPRMRAEGPGEGDECLSGAAERAAASSAPRGGVRCRSGGRQQRHLRARARRRDAQRFAGIRPFLVAPFYRGEN